ncbi:MAG: TauD/TfdA family dioxygenase [Acidimicrobiales bacterium]|nr:TauD/TfdA family dioxygenase [Acidimicrobiales bacterium]
MTTDLDVRPLTTAIGAEIRGVDLSAPLDDATRDAIQAALDDRLVLFFRDQPMTPAQHIDLARRFGEISVTPFQARDAAHPEVLVLDQDDPRGEGADRWHSDNTFMATPPMGSLLRAIKLPSVGGDTCFASMYAAYELLSPELQRAIAGLRAVHDILPMLQRAETTGVGSWDFSEMRRAWPPQEHPMVRTHPQTGRKALFVNSNFTVRIVGMEEKESDALLRLLFAHVGSPEIQCRFRWTPDALAFWDNRSVQHYAVADYVERRVMHRVTLVGDAPA